MAGPKSHKGRRNKGARGEREFFTILNRFLPERLRLQRELSQTRDGGVDGQNEFFAIEVKRQEKVYLTRWVKQAREATSVGQQPVVAYRQNNDNWKVLVEMDVIQFAAYMRYQHNIADTVNTLRDSTNSLPQ